MPPLPPDYYGESPETITYAELLDREAIERFVQDCVATTSLHRLNETIDAEIVAIRTFDAPVAHGADELARLAVRSIARSAPFLFAYSGNHAAWFFAGLESYWRTPRVGGLLPGLADLAAYESHKRLRLQFAWPTWRPEIAYDGLRRAFDGMRLNDAGELSIAAAKAALAFFTDSIPTFSNGPDQPASATVDPLDILRITTAIRFDYASLGTATGSGQEIFRLDKNLWPTGLPSWWNEWRLRCPSEAAYVLHVVKQCDSPIQQQDALADASLPPGDFSALKLRIAIETGTRKLEEQRNSTAKMLQGMFHDVGVVLPSSLEEGQELAQSVNELLAQHGCRLCFPGTSDPATLNFGRISKEPRFYLSGTTGGGRTTKPIHAGTGRAVGDFAALEVIPAPPDKRRKKL